MLTHVLACPADKAVGTTVEVDFTKGENDFFTVAEGTTLTYDPTLGAVFTINKETDAPTISSNGYIFFGKVDVTVRASAGVGIVTSVVLQSDDLDEIDWEWLGGDTTQVQTNYFSKGDTTTYDRGGFSDVSNPQSTFDTYTIDWTSERINWIINGNIVRTLTYADAKNGATFPQTPMQLKLGTWVAGRSDAAQGTIEWAGGLTNFDEAPFLGYYQKVVVEDYSKGAKQYVYGDLTGTMASIKIETEDNSSSSVSESASATKTSSSGTASASSTFSTVTGSSTATVVNGGFPLATAGSSNAEVSSDSNSSSASSTSAAASSTSAVTTSGATTNAGVNIALIGAALLALIAM